MKRVRPLAALAMMLAAVPAGAGCGDDDDGSAASDAGTSNEPAPSPNQAGEHSISGSVAVGVAHRTIVTLSGAADAAALPDLQGGFRFDGLKDGDYLLTPSTFGYTFMPASRAVTLEGADAEALDFVAIAEDSSSTR